MIVVSFDRREDRGPRLLAYAREHAHLCEPDKDTGGDRFLAVFTPEAFIKFVAAFPL